MKPVDTVVENVSTASQTQAQPQVEVHVLDDDPDFRNYMEDALKDSTYSIHTLALPDELYSACEQHVPDIVLLDMKMGEFKGEKVLEQLLAMYPNLCVIIITAAIGRTLTRVRCEVCSPRRSRSRHPSRTSCG